MSEKTADLKIAENKKNEPDDSVDDSSASSMSSKK